MNTTPESTQYWTRPPLNGERIVLLLREGGDSSFYCGKLRELGGDPVVPRDKAELDAALKSKPYGIITILSDDPKTCMLNWVDTHYQTHDYTPVGLIVQPGEIEGDKLRLCRTLNISVAGGGLTNDIGTMLRMAISSIKTQIEAGLSH